VLVLSQINGVVEHSHGDSDSLVSAALVRYCVKQQFPGKEIEVVFAEKPWRLSDLKEKGYVSVDYGWQGLTKEEREDPLVFEYVIDHHRPGEKRSATKMVAEALGVFGQGLIDDFIDLVDIRDNEGTAALSSELELIDGVSPKLIHRARLYEYYSILALSTIHRRRHKDSALQTYFNRIVTDMIDHSLYFRVTVTEEFRKKAVVSAIWIGDRKTNMVVIESSISEVSAYSRTKEGGYCAVTVLKNLKTGHVMIQANQGCRPIIDLAEAAKIIRFLEMAKRGIIDEYELSDLGAEGMIDLCPYWFVPKNSRTGIVWMITNGSLKHKDVEATALSLDEIRVALILSFSDFFPSCCPRTHCFGRHHCSLYPVGFERCTRIREKQS